MDNPEKLATQNTQDAEKHNTICVGHHYTQTKTNNVNKGLKGIAIKNVIYSNTRISYQGNVRTHACRTLVISLKSVVTIDIN